VSQKKLQTIDDISQWSVSEAYRELTSLRNEFTGILKLIPSELKISVQDLTTSIEQHLIQARILLLTTDVSTAINQILQAKKEFEELQRHLHQSVSGGT
jgi:uncharacterized membrane protein (DUF485 family)